MSDQNNLKRFGLEIKQFGYDLRLWDNLLPIEQNIILKLKGDDSQGKTLDEIGEEVGLTPKQMTKIFAKGMKKLRTYSPSTPPKRPAVAAGIPREPIFFDYSPKKPRKKPR